MNIAEIKPITTENGEGCRVSVFVSGCNIHCPECHNKEAWDFEYGTPYTLDTQYKISEYLNHEYINGISILGGEPLDGLNLNGVYEILQAVHDEFGDTKSVWLYTGYNINNIIKRAERMGSNNIISDVLKLCNVIVDGPFIDADKDPSLAFRGSTNQHIYNIKYEEYDHNEIHFLISDYKNTL